MNAWFSLIFFLVGAGTAFFSFYAGILVGQRLTAGEKKLIDFVPESMKKKEPPKKSRGGIWVNASRTPSSVPKEEYEPPHL